MATAVERALRATTYGKSPTSLTARLTEFERSERLRRAGAIFLPLFGAALFSLFIPAWHFVGVPGFLTLAFVLGRGRLLEAAAVDSLEGTCPSCGVPQHFAPQAKFELPVTLRCPGCSAFVKLESQPEE
jgi:hypothetical protein